VEFGGVLVKFGGVLVEFGGVLVKFGGVLVGFIIVFFMSTIELIIILFLLQGLILLLCASK
jgi:hypothetical protein